jgi:3-oxo-5-alpha-steroid 4-dehydrogenase 1
MFHWYTGDSTYDTILTAALGFAVFVFVASWFLPSPYGRFESDKFGVSVSPKLGWFLMELPATLSFLYFFSRGPNRQELVPTVLAAMWCLHYANRGFFFPWAMRVPKGQKGSFSMLVIVTGWLVTAMHGYFHGSYFSRYGEHYMREWLTDPRFIAGFVLYYVFMAGNLHADHILRNLRSREEIERGERVYRVPQGGMYRWVTSPSYLCELCAWASFAVCTWSLAGVFIFVVSAANLVPRAVATHRWYQQKFPDYPKERKALIPFVW